MRWGVRDEATDDHMTTELCMREIVNCQRLSMGPNFVVGIQNDQMASNETFVIVPCRYFLVRNMDTGIILLQNVFNEMFTHTI